MTHRSLLSQITYMSSHSSCLSILTLMEGCKQLKQKADNLSTTVMYVCGFVSIYLDEN